MYSEFTAGKLAQEKRCGVGLNRCLSHRSAKCTIFGEKRWSKPRIHFAIFTMDVTRDLTNIPMSVFSRVSTSRNKSSFVGGYLRHGERFAAWFTGQSWWMRSRTMSGDRTEERERERERKNKSRGGRK